MLRDHHRAALMFQTGDLVVEPGDGVLVQIGRGLVQHKNLRAHGIDRAEGQQLLLPTGQGEDAPPLQFLKVQGLHRIRHPPSDLLRRPALIFQTEGQFTVRVQIEELGFGVLEYGADFPGQLVHGCRSRVKSVHIYPPFQAAAGGKGRDQAVDQLRHRGLTAARGPAQQDTLPGCDGCADLGERLLRLPIAERNMVNRNHVRSPLIVPHMRAPAR